MKTCAKCGTQKPQDSRHFRSQNRQHDGLDKVCIACRGPARVYPRARVAMPPSPYAPEFTRDSEWIFSDHGVDALFTVAFVAPHCGKIYVNGTVSGKRRAMPVELLRKLSRRAGTEAA